MFSKSKTIFTIAIGLLSLYGWSGSLEDTKRGEEIYQSPTGCQMCHGKKSEGLVGPALTYGPSPDAIDNALKTVIQMGPIAAQLQLTDSDIYDIALYLQKFKVND